MSNLLKQYIYLLQYSIREQYRCYVFVFYWLIEQLHFPNKGPLPSFCHAWKQLTTLFTVRKPTPRSSQWWTHGHCNSWRCDSRRSMYKSLFVLPRMSRFRFPMSARSSLLQLCCCWHQITVAERFSKDVTENENDENLGRGHSDDWEYITEYSLVDTCIYTAFKIIELRSPIH